uniref:Uncharacterized protein n=2 Tax=Ixodes scapularis TaxID=6945 RepID=A0A1S4LHS2_IXOSC
LVNKSVDFQHVVIEHETYVVVVTETWLHSDIQDYEVCPPGYNIIRNDRYGRGGGVAIIVDNRIRSTLIQHPPDIES